MLTNNAHRACARNSNVIRQSALDRARAKWFGSQNINLAAYVGSDPINFHDPLGLAPQTSKPVTDDCDPNQSTTGCEPIEVYGPWPSVVSWLAPISWDLELAQREIVIVARRRWRNLRDLIKGKLTKAVCSSPSLGGGYGGDAYGGLGGSVGFTGGFSPSTLQLSMGGNVAVGVGLGFDVGPSVSISDIHGRGSASPVQANIAWTVGGAVGLGASGTNNILGTNAGTQDMSFGRAGLSAYANAGANFSFSTPEIKICD